MERILYLALILLLLFTACGAKQSRNEVESVSCPAAPVEQTTAAQDRQPAGEADETASEANQTEEFTAVSVADTTQPPATEASAKPPAETTASEIPTSRTGTTITDTFIVKQVQGTLLTLYRYDAAKGGELKSGAYTADYGSLDGADKMSFSVGDIVTVRYDQEIAETYPMQLTVREIYPAEWNN